MKLSKSNEELLKAYERGYRVKKGTAYRSDNYPMSSIKDSGGYLFFKPNNNIPVYIHRFVAYQKFGRIIFNSNIQVRHLDGNKLNNLNNNIDIGSPSDNMMDKKASDREKHSINASNKIRRFTDKEMELIREDYETMKSYKDVMALWGISSKGTLHYILNNKYVTTKK